MSIRDEPHYEVPSTELATWLERQGDAWWTVDGDRLLAGRVFVPCPGDELAQELRRLNRPLLVQDRRPSPSGKGETIGADELGALVRTLTDNVRLIRGEEKLNEMQDRLFFFSWKGSPEEWVLVEDSQTTQSSRADAASIAGNP